MEKFMSRMKLSPSVIFLGMLGAALVAASAAHAKSGAYKYAPDYSDIRGFNYNTASSLNTEDQWRTYKHAEVDRDFGYAQRLGLNSVRVFLSYKAWLADKTAFRANLRDFVRTAAAHRIGAMIEVVNGPGGMMPDLFEESAKPKLREYVKDLVDTIGNEPGLSFWDAANEPDWVRPPEAMPNTNQPQRIAVAQFVASVFQELDTDTPVTIGCLFLTCTMETASFVDVLSYHDYSQTRAQIVADIERGQKFAASVNKPIINTEMACVGRANPYDIEIEEHNKAKMGWFIWELMVARYWGNVHGIFYPNGTIRDPSIVAAVMGFYRNRGPDIVMEETDREGITSGLLDDARKWLADANPDYFSGMVLAETEANALEAGQLTAMRDLPTRKVDMLRSGPQNIPALRLLIEKFTAELAANAIAGQTPRHRFYTPAVAR
jgi:hypothetical protein